MLQDDDGNFLPGTEEARADLEALMDAELDQMYAERDIVISKAQEQFWAEIQDAYQLKSGDLPPEAIEAFDDACVNAVECWLTWNGHGR